MSDQAIDAGALDEGALIDAGKALGRHPDIVERYVLAYRRALSAAKPTSTQEAGEVVAWMFPRRYGSGLSFAKPANCFDEDGNPCEPTPLYATPPTPDARADAFARAAVANTGGGVHSDAEMAEAMSGDARADAERTWRCFHCDEVFSSVEAAREHFGQDEICTAGCCIDIAEYRRMEAVHRDHVNETDEASRTFYAMRDDHRRALIAAEQKGYDKGLADARADAEGAGWDSGMREAAEIARRAYLGHGDAFKTDRARNYEHAGRRIALDIEARITEARQAQDTPAG